MVGWHDGEYVRSARLHLGPADFVHCALLGKIERPCQLPRPKSPGGTNPQRPWWEGFGLDQDLDLDLVELHLDLNLDLDLNLADPGPGPCLSLCPSMPIHADAHAHADAA